MNLKQISQSFHGPAGKMQGIAEAYFVEGLEIKHTEDSIWKKIRLH